MKKTYLINDDSKNMRLDRWFKRYVGQIPQSLIEKSLRKGKIKVNKKKVKSSYYLIKNDLVSINNFNFSLNKINKENQNYVASKKDLSQSSKFILENNDNFVVINKPSGIAVQSGTKSRKNILDILKKTKEFDGFYPFAVHRIDKETTGVLIVAKNREYAQLFTSLFRIRKIHKTYLGVVLGEFENKKGTLTDYLINFEGDKKVKYKAITHFKVIDSNIRYSLLKLDPVTGRKHQLRKQLLISGHPIYGDSKYKLIDKNKNTKSSLMLHAYKINFSIKGTKYNFIAEPPKAFSNFLKEKYLKNYL